jgi:hypothetical protein
VGRERPERSAARGIQRDGRAVAAGQKDALANDDRGGVGRITQHDSPAQPQAGNVLRAERPIAVDGAALGVVSEDRPIGGLSDTVREDR